MLAVGALTVAGGVLAAVGGLAQTGAPPEAAADDTVTTATVGPDVVVFSFADGISSWGAAGGYVAYSVGTVSCNRGDAPLSWCAGNSGCAPGAGNDDHPAIGQNLYRLKAVDHDGTPSTPDVSRFQQIGMSWLKHGFTSLNQETTGCKESSPTGTCEWPPFNGNQLGAGCTDPYSANLNGSQTRLGPHFEANATTGALVIPHATPGSVNIYDGRLKVVATDVDPAQNTGAKYWAEAQYIAGDDAAAARAFNNASYQRVTVGSGTGFPLSRTGPFFEQQPAINAWRAEDPGAILADVDVAGAIVERFQVARKVTDLGGGSWHYEYAVRNHNSDRSARSFSVTFPGATTFGNVGFHDVEHHSGEPYATTDWAQDTTANTVSWSTDSFATDANANALRALSMFNFWFDADQRPNSDVDTPELHVLGLFKPGDPATVVFEGFNGLFDDGFEGGNFNVWGGHS